MRNEQAFKDVLCHFASGVTVVSMSAANGSPNGMTVSAFCSLSLQPPSILISISHHAECHADLLSVPQFAVNILRADQQALMQAFAMTGDDKQAALTRAALLWQSAPHGTPWFPCIARLECRRSAVHDAGDHSIIIGEVLATYVDAADADPMIYLRRGLWS